MTKFVKTDDGFSCNECAKTVQVPVATYSHGLKNGFTVNPITGEKEIRDENYTIQKSQQLKGLGNSDHCPKCDKPVYVTDKVPGPFVRNWHKGCLKCAHCSKPLDSSSPTKDNQAYCSTCFRIKNF